uniref:Membrane protein insertion efficiency factor n=1 Tax=Coccolithus braarudii TaxID=221442 RepID=A0A7S0QB70_9EUKA
MCSCGCHLPREQREDLALARYTGFNSERERQQPAGAVTEWAVGALKWYKRALSPLLPPGCRFVPTCSEYAIQSFEQFSPVQAAVLTVWRLVRCNPTAGYGVDAPQWPPPGYWAGSQRVRTSLDDQASRRRALESLESPPAGGAADNGDAIFGWDLKGRAFDPATSVSEVGVQAEAEADDERSWRRGDGSSNGS